MSAIQVVRRTTIVLATAGAAACSALRPEAVAIPGPLEGNSFTVRNVRVFDGERVVEPANVVVRDGRIVSVNDARPPADLPVIEGAGHTLIPGLIDAHAHPHTEDALRDALRFGVTTELDMMSRLEFVTSQRARRNSMARTDLADVYTSGQPVTSPGGMGTQFGIPYPTITAPEQAEEFVRARLAEGSDYIKLLYEPDAGIVSTISYETLAAVVAAARAQGAVTGVHVSSIAGARGVVEAGADGLAHLFSDSVIDDALARRIADKGMFVIATLSIFGAFEGSGLGADLAADPRIAPLLSAAQRSALMARPIPKEHPMAGYTQRFQLARGLENVRRLHAAGVRILVGDDAGVGIVAHGASLHGELELLTRAGLTPAAALNAATGATAEVFKLGDRGRIAAGARADLVLVAGDPTTDIRATRAIVRVFKNGHEVPRVAPAAPAAK